MLSDKRLQMATQPAPEESFAAKQEDEILVEKDGRFELVKVQDMEAVNNSSEQVPELEAGAGGGGTNLELHGAVDALSSSNNAQSEEKSTEKASEIDTSIKSESTVKFIVEETQSPSQVNTNVLTATTSASVISPTSKPRPPLSSRTKSAPGYRDNYQDETMKKERNEAAFRAWRSKKDRQISQQRQTEVSKVKQSDEEQREKEKRNEVAYKAWLECKKQYYQEQRAKEKASRPITSITRDQEERKLAAFENWLSVKQQDKQKENDSQQKYQQQEEMSAKKADSSLVSAAYKRYAE